MSAQPGIEADRTKLQATDETGGPAADDIRQFLTFRLSRVQARLNAQAAAVLAAHSDLNLVEWRLIALIANFGDGTSAALAKHAGMDKGLFSRKLKRLEAAGYIRFRTDKQDQRRQILSLNKRGIETYERLIIVMRRRQQHLRKDFEAHELDVLYRALDKLAVLAEQREF